MILNDQNRSFLDLLPDGVMIVDAEGKILYANPAMSKLLKRPLSEIKGGYCYKLIHGTEERPPFCVHDLMHTEDKPVTREFFEPHLKVWLWAYGAPIRDESGKIRACFHITRDVTAEKNNLIGSHLFEKIVDTLPGYFYLSDKDYRILAANQRFKNWVGMEPIGHKCHEVIHGSPKPCKWCRQKIIFEKGKTIEWETICSKDQRWYLAINTPFDSPSGERFKITLIFDIDRRKRLEERLKRVFEESPAAIFISDWEGNIKLANPALRKLLKVPLDLDLTRFKTSDFYVNQEDRNRLLQELEKKKEISGYELEIKDFLGQKLWVALTLKMVKEEGQYHIWGTLQDITVRKKAEQALIESEARFRVLAENAPLGVILIDDQDKIIYFNPAAEKIFGYKTDEILGKSFHLILASTNSYKGALASFKQIPKIGNSHLANQRFELQTKRKDGTVFPAEIFLSIIQLPDKLYYLWIIQDISERKKLEEKRLQLEKHRALELLAGGIAHDFNNILASIIGNLELAQKLTEDQKLKNILKRAEKVACEARNLARDLLTFSKGDIPVPKEVDLRSFLGELARFLLHGSAIKLHLEIPEGLPPVKIDPTHLAQAIQNLILNAKEAMPEGGELFIQAVHVDDRVVIVVRDTGPGIPKDILPKIFEPGFTTKPAGTGIGLSVVKTVVERYNGEISVHSVPGKGTTFKIFLPAGESKKKSRSEKKTLIREPKIFSGQVLVMDDEESIRILLKETLTLMGLSVETAEDGEEALEKYRKALETGNPFDLVILDLTVPGGKGGVWTIERLRKLDPQVKAILSTGYTLDDVRKIVKDLPFVDILRKPYTMDELSQILEKHILEKKS
ncbi:hybrid sensor histidine kinase/response regulator [Thermosulfurimonas dismutans]|uniref:histidine kinase n=1 Tax=Thermosulfurimonas dismutans TaxID=999894 RepID=A0A179D6D5_9BACT|nr:PAS domain S-box protein [Thermosulfurimonas dismutans]OAQ21607.1 hypothetical protein TDIS_0125 [Thermosulfurimonas dismutans]